jgi:hypothetical protein
MNLAIACISAFLAPAQPTAYLGVGSLRGGLAEVTSQFDFGDPSAAVLTTSQTKPKQKIVSLAKVVGVSMFKNGYAVVTRQFDVDASGTTNLGFIPASSIGTLWFSTTGGAQLKTVTATTMQSNATTILGNLDQILAANVGKVLRLTYRQGEAGYPSVKGKLLAISGELIVLETPAGQQVLSKVGIQKITPEGGKLVFSTNYSAATRVVQFKTTGKGKIQMLSLERGISWTPGYAIELIDDKELKVVSKATITNDLSDLVNLDVRLITGFPNLPWAGVLEPFLSGSPTNGPLLGGGFGGGGQAPAAMMTQNRAAKEAVMADFSLGMSAPADASGEQKEDLFFYKYPKVSLKTGDRGYYILFEAKSPYKTLFTADLPDSTSPDSTYRGLPDGPADVWNTLQFRNASGQPLTTSIATAFSKGDIVGQGMLNYTPANADAELQINKSLDIRVEATEEELSRQRGAIKYFNSEQPLYDLVTLKGVIEIRNDKNKEVKLRIRKQLSGEILEAETAEVAKTAKGLKAVNPNATLTWNPTLSPGKSLKLNYSYKLYLRSS